MYMMSQGYVAGPAGGNGGYSRLESMAGGSSYSSSSGAIRYSASAGTNLGQSSAPMFISSSRAYNSSTSPLGMAYRHGNSLYQMFSAQPEYNFVADNFLKPGKGSKFVGKAEEVREFVEETFEKMLNVSFPNNIKLSILDKKEFSKLSPHASTIGLSINRNKQGLLSEIFILNDTLGRVMLTIGHELGHVLTETLSSAYDEEAKAYAFSLAWMETIKENNIAGLGDAIILENPAMNGLHDVSFEFVSKMVKQGRKVWDVYLGLVRGMLSVAG